MCRFETFWQDLSIFFIIGESLKEKRENSDNETMKRIVKYSIRDKLLVLLVSIPLISLCFFVFFGARHFVKDKNAYIFDAAAKNATQLSSEFFLSFQSYQRVLNSILTVSDLENGKLGASSQKRFREQSMIEYLFLAELNKTNVKRLDQLINYPREIKSLKLADLDITSLRRIMGKNDHVIVDYPDRSRFFVFMQRLSDELENESSVERFLIGLVKIPEIYEAFATPGVYASYLVHTNQAILIQPKFWRKSKTSQLLTDARVFLPAFKKKTPQGVFEISLPDKNKLTVAFAQTKIPEIYAFSVVDQSVIMTSIHRFFLKSLLLLGVVLSLVIFIGFMTSFRLTESLRKLMEVTKKIGAGNFDVTVDIHSNDEIGVLAGDVQWMSGEVVKLMANQVEQARMESELGMVQLVQKNLFPPLSNRVGNFEIECRFSSASEAGGDWFHYTVFEKSLILWIGDATGHGAPAAMITAAAKSASSVIEFELEKRKVSPNEIMKVLNRSVNATAKKSVMMTFFVASIDLETGLVTYANASHEPPILIPAKDKVHKKDFHVLCDVNGKRLGESKESEYPEGQHQMRPGETLFLYTDGITDLENSKGENFGDGRLLRTLAKQASGQPSTFEFADRLNRSFETYREKTPLVDDLMYIACRYNAVVETEERAAS